jgi:hypothetical protein
MNGSGKGCGMARKITIGRRRFSAIQLVSAAAGVVAVVGTIGGVALFQRSTAITKARAWTAVGPPCPSLSQADFLAAGVQMAHTIVYDDVTFARGYGYANCNEIADKGGRGVGVVPVCQFNSPTALQVTTRRGTFYFATRSSPATVSIADGVPHCVMATTQTLE